MRRPRIYIMGPYTKPDPARNVHEAMQLWHWLELEGFSPYLPHLSHFLHIAEPRAYEVWLRHDLEWLAMCDAAVRLSGESPGADRECTEARRLDIPVFNDFTYTKGFKALIAWRDEWEKRKAQ